MIHLPIFFLHPAPLPENQHLAIGPLALMVIAGIAYISIKVVPTYFAGLPADIMTLRVLCDSAYVAQGVRIATPLCNECHNNIAACRRSILAVTV